MRATTVRALPRVTVFTGRGCTLCVDVIDALHAARGPSSRPRFEIDTVDIRNNPAPDAAQRRRAYQYDIPVVHVGDREAFRHRFDAQKLDEALAAVAGTP